MDDITFGNIKASIDADKIFGRTSTSSINSHVARETMMAEVEGRAGIPYGLDEDRQEIILVHGRQDAAHALLNTVSILQDLRTIDNNMKSRAFGIFWKGLILINTLMLYLILAKLTK